MGRKRIHPIVEKQKRILWKNGKPYYDLVKPYPYTIKGLEELEVFLVAISPRTWKLVDKLTGCALTSYEVKKADIDAEAQKLVDTGIEAIRRAQENFIREYGTLDSLTEYKEND